MTVELYEYLKYVRLLLFSLQTFFFSYTGHEDVVTFLALKQRIDRLFMKCPPHTCLKISVNGTLPCLLV